MTNSGRFQADEPVGLSVGDQRLRANEVNSMVVDSQSRCIDADQADQLVERNYAAVYRYAFRMVGCAATAEDIAQDVFVKAIAHLDQLRSADAERGWLLSITRREFMRWLRQVAQPAIGRVSSLDENAALDTDGNTEASPPLDNIDWVQAALSELNEDARVALLMYYFEDLSYAEIAQQLQIPIGTVMSRLSRGREHLRQGLERLARPQPTASPSVGNSPSSSASRTAPAALHGPVIGSQGQSKPSVQEVHHG